MNLGFLTQKEGPLPVWGWVAIGAAAYFFLFRKSSQAGSQGIQYVMSYVPQTSAGGISGGSGVTTSPLPPITATPIQGPPVTTPPSPTPPTLNPQQILAYLQWANPNPPVNAMDWNQFSTWLNNASPQQLAEQSQEITSSPYYQQYQAGQSVYAAAPWLGTPDNSTLTATQGVPPSVHGGA